MIKLSVAMLGIAAAQLSVAQNLLNDPGFDNGLTDVSTTLFDEDEALDVWAADQTFSWRLNHYASGGNPGGYIGWTGTSSDNSARAILQVVTDSKQTTGKVKLSFDVRIVDDGTPQLKAAVWGVSSSTGSYSIHTFGNDFPDATPEDEVLLSQWNLGGNQYPSWTRISQSAGADLEVDLGATGYDLIIVGIWSKGIQVIGTAPFDDFGIDNVTLQPDNDTAPPVVIGFSPPDDAPAVALDANLEATFDEEIVKGSGNITLSNLSDGTSMMIDMDSEVSVSGSVLTINPGSDLLTGKNYAVLIDPGAVRDLAGLDFPGISDPTTWNFTSWAPDVTSPVIVSGYPISGAVDVPIDAVLELSFDEPVVAGSGNITLVNLNQGTSVDMSVADPRVTVNGSMLMIDLAGLLDYSGNYTVLTDMGIVEDQSGNPLGGISDLSFWSFQTVLPPPEAGDLPFVYRFESDGVLSFRESQAAAVYRLERSPDLQGPWISEVDRLTGNGMEHIVSCAVPMEGSRHFYRVRELAGTHLGAMVYIPGGSFNMGDSFGDANTSNETPVHEVHISGFFMQNTEVTDQELADVLNWAYGEGKVSIIGIYVHNAEGSSSQRLINLDATWTGIRWDAASSTFQVKNASRANRPALSITWYGAAACCNYLSDMQGLTRCYDFDDWSCNFDANGYRLPTEAEWEKAARGGVDGRRFPWGDIINHDHANYWAGGDVYAYEDPNYATRTSHPTWGLDIAPVGSFPANGYGLYDMAGNNGEWCNDFYSGDYYEQPEASQPDPTGPATGFSRCFRWACYGTYAYHSRNAYRTAKSPTDGDDNSGFRPVRR